MQEIQRQYVLSHKSVAFSDQDDRDRFKSCLNDSRTTQGVRECCKTEWVWLDRNEPSWILLRQEGATSILAKIPPLWIDVLQPRILWNCQVLKY